MLNFWIFYEFEHLTKEYEIVSVYDQLSDMFVLYDQSSKVFLLNLISLYCFH